MNSNEIIFFPLYVTLSTFHRNELSPASDTISRFLLSISVEPSFFMSNSTNAFITLALLM